MIFKQELRFSWRSMLTWTISILIFFALFMGIYPTFEKESESFMAVIQNVPSALLQGFGIDLSTIFSPSGFLSYLYGLIQLLLGISGLLYGLRLLGREKTDRTTSFLFSKPIPWSSIFLQKLLVGILAILIINFSIYLLWLIVQQIMNLDQSGVAKMLSTGVVLQFSMLSLGILLSVFKRRLENPLGLASGIAMGLYVIHILGRLTDLLWFHRLSPYYYVDPVRLLQEGHFWRDNVILLTLSLLCLSISYLGYIKRDKEA